MIVQDILSAKPVKGVVSIGANRRLSDLVILLAEKNIGAVVATDAAGRLCGVISERDLVRALAEVGPDALDESVSDRMTRDVQTARMEDTAVSVLERMTERRFRHMPVVTEGGLAGVLSIGDLVKSRIDTLQRDNAALEEFIRS